MYSNNHNRNRLSDTMSLNRIKIILWNTRKNEFNHWTPHEQKKNEYFIPFIWKGKAKKKIKWWKWLNGNEYITSDPFQFKITSPIQLSGTPSSGNWWIKIFFIFFLHSTFTWNNFSSYIFHQMKCGYWTWTTKNTKRIQIIHRYNFFCLLVHWFSFFE